MPDEEKKANLELTHDQLVLVQDLVGMALLSLCTRSGADMGLDDLIIKEALAQRIKKYLVKIGHEGMHSFADYVGKTHDQYHDAVEVEGFLKEIHKHE